SSLTGATVATGAAGGRGAVVPTDAAGAAGIAPVVSLAPTSLLAAGAGTGAARAGATEAGAAAATGAGAAAGFSATGAGAATGFSAGFSAALGRGRGGVAGRAVAVACTGAVELPGNTITRVPTWTRPYRSAMSSLVSRMQPDETNVPIVEGWL